MWQLCIDSSLLWNIRCACAIVSCFYTSHRALFVCACVRACVYAFYLLTTETIRSNTQTASRPGILSMVDLLITFYLLNGTCAIHIILECNASVWTIVCVPLSAYIPFDVKQTLSKFYEHRNSIGAEMFFLNWTTRASIFEKWPSKTVEDVSFSQCANRSNFWFQWLDSTRRPAHDKLNFQWLQNCGEV